MKNNIKTLIILPIMLFASLFVIPAIPNAHAVGLVCLGPDGSTTCATPPVSISGTVGSSLRIAVIISGSAPLNGFDITLLADHTVLKPTGADLTGSVVPGATVVVDCLQGVLVTGSTCLATDTIDTLHFAAVGSKTTGTTSGLLFTAIYQVVSSTAGTPIGFQTGCGTTTSVPPDVCVTIVDGTPTSVPETAQSATVATPDFLISASPSTIFMLAGATGTSTITLTAVGGYGDLVNVAISSTTPSITASLSASQVDLVSVTTNTVTLTVGPAANGNYKVNITATGSGTFSTTVPTHTITVTVSVGPPDFSVTASPSSLSIPHGSSGTSTISVGSLGGFAGTVSLTATAPAGITASPSSNTVTAPASYTLTISVASTVAPGTYTVTVTGTATTGTHSATITVNVGSPGFSVSVLPARIGVFRGASAAAQITVTSLNNFAGTVCLTIAIVNATVPDSAGSTAVPTTLSPSCVTLTAGSSATSTLIILAPLSVATAFYNATITGTSGSTTASALLVFNVEDFSMTAKYPTIVITNQTGIITTDLVTVTSLGGLNAEGAAVVAAIPSGWTPGVPLIPIHSSRVPELGRSLCLLDTFYANGTQIPFSRLATNGPISWVGFTARCGRNDGNAFPTPGSPDVFTDANGVPGIQLQVLSHTPLGTYTVKLIAIYGLLTRSITITVIVVQAPLIHQLSFPNPVSWSATGGVMTIKVGVSVPGSRNLYVNVQITAVGSAGLVVTGTSGTFKINGGGNANNIPITLLLPKSAIGQTFTFQAIILVGTAPNALTGTSTQSSIFGATFTVVP